MILPRLSQPQHAAHFRLQDLLVSLFLFVGVTALHMQQGQAVASTVLLQSYNWLFDFDASRYLGGWCLPGVNVSEHLYFNHVARHPLTVMLRPACLAIEPLFSSPAGALMAVTAALAGLMSALSYALAARCCPTVLDRLLIAAVASLSAQPLMLGIIPEMYGPAMLGVALSLLWLSGLPGRGEPTRLQWVITGVLNLGLTVTNAMLSLIASAVTAWGLLSFKTWVWREIAIWIWVGVGLLVSSLLLAWAYTPEHLEVAGHAVKSLWWAANMVSTEKAPLWKVAATFLVYDVVAPISSFYQLPAGENHPMLDFRAYTFTPAGWCASVLWLGLLTTSTAWAWQNTALRRPLAVAILWLAFNILLHTFWQYRASIYIYGAHSYPALVVIVALGHGQAVARSRTWAGSARVAWLGLALLLLLNNGERYRDLIAFLVNQTAAR